MRTISPPLSRSAIVRISRHFDPLGTDGTGLPPHFGLDLSCHEGMPIYAARDGVAYRGSQPSGFGLYVRLEAADSLYVYTAHLRNWAVADGARVKAGDIIGYSGNTGNSTGPHLHFEVRKGSRLQASAVDPEPLIEWPAATVTSKLGLHFQNLPAWHTAVVNESAVRWVKMIDPSGPYPYSRKVNVIGRLWTGGDAIDQALIDQREAGAETYFAQCLPRYHAAPWVTVWEGPNEPAPFWDRMQNLNAFSLRWARLMHEHGLACAVGCFSVGRPDTGTIHLMRDALEEADYLALHEYSQPTMQTDQTWLCLRYLRTVQELTAASIRIPPILITECGIDGGAVTPERESQKRPGVGWKGFATREAYRAQLYLYNEQLCKDKRVVCATPFVSGPTAEWESFDFDEGLARWACDTHGEAIPEIPPVVPPIDTAPPPSEPLPNDEQGTPAVLATKARYWEEEQERQWAAGNVDRAHAIRLSQIELLERLEGALA